MKWALILIHRTLLDVFPKLNLYIYLLYSLCICALKIAILFKFCTNIYFSNSFDKFGGQKNPLITFTPHFGVFPKDFAFWGLKKLFWKTFLEMG